LKVPTPKKCPDGYKLQLRLNGTSVMVYGSTAAECRRNAELTKAEHRVHHTVTSAGKLTLRESIDLYISAKSSVVSPSTVRGYRTIQKNRFSAYMDVPMSSVDWQSAVNEEARSVSAKTVSNAWGLVSSVMTFLHIPKKPVTLPQIVGNEHPFLTKEQIPVFLDAIRGTRVELPALLGLHGLRRSEIYALTPESFSGGCIHVRGAVVYDEHQQLHAKPENKNRSSRRDVPIMIDRLTELLAEGAPMYAVPISNFSKAVNTVCRRSGLPEIGAHGLRHSFASAAYGLLTEAETMKLGGWSDPGTMRKIYTHISRSEIEAAAAKMRGVFNP